MFKDYYAILDIPFDASREEVKAAYRRQTLTWHPDRNPGKDTTEEMKDVNEAYLILEDLEARAKYDREYHRFQRSFFEETASNQKGTQGTNDEVHSREHTSNPEDDFEVEDDLLRTWMKNAREQAEDLVRRFNSEMKETGKEAAQGVSTGFLTAVRGEIIAGVILTLVVAIVRGCH